MTTLTLFGLALAPLYAAIAQVESDRGATSSNVYQIDEDGHGYVDDVNRIIRLRAGKVATDGRRQSKLRLFTAVDVLNRSQAEYMMAVYWSHWGEHFEKKTGRPVTYEVLARIHNGGPLGWKKPSTGGYWIRVASVMATQKASDVEAWAKGGAR